MANNTFLPLATDFLLAVDVSANNVGVADVLTGARSLFAPDPASVRLLGLYDVGYGNKTQNIILAPDGKSLSVTGEGNWMVDKVTGVITFISDQELAGPPTPAVFQYCDAMGNWSNEALVVMDPDLATSSQALASLTSVDDDVKFWTNYQNHVSMGYNMDTDTFVAVTSLLATGYRVALKGAIGPNPVAWTDYTAAYDAWQKAGGKLDDDPLKPTGNGLFPICAKMVDTAMAGDQTKFLARFWRLELMARMAAFAGVEDDE